MTGPERVGASTSVGGPASKLAFQYFVIRCVPRVDRGEVMNIGVVLYCQEADFLAVGADVRPERLAALDPRIDVEAIAKALQTVDAVCRGDARGGEAASGSLGQRFGWLAAPRSTALQPGPTHGGLTDDPRAEVDRLLDALVR